MPDVVYAVILLLLGLFLLFLEVAIIPGIGLVGIGGAIAYGAGVFIVWNSLGGFGVLMAVITSVPLFLIAMWLFFKTGASQRLVLKDQINGDSSSVPGHQELLGRKGLALSSLRPAGVALFGEVRYDVVTDGDFIEKGTPVVIVKIGTNSLVVSKLED